ncbi:sensor histidine kinase [Streptosporangium pseudovulgare]|uniref:Two-component sensor histidine kinase n=1 Tax=Streptosporangium pseudovulgare TaxID=35765 RepID=A0ABQ2RA29_9ACTN|nr:sensor histidine kinase [Streptosporangium pseudovulgare]GGQ16121.1 two-component sensor histidine kinase [Streptosporangium pseudovulgare]
MNTPPARVLRGVDRDRLLLLARLSIGLTYLCFPILEIVTGEVTGVSAAWGVLGLVAFVACYAAAVLAMRAFGDPGRATYRLLGAATVLAVVLAVAFGGDWLALPIFMAVMHGVLLPSRVSMAGIAAMGVTVLLVGLLREHDPGMTLLLLLQAVTLGVLFRGMRSTRLLVSQLRRAQEEVARLAASEERLRIARDLHDLLGHSLSLIVLKSELAGRLAEEGSEGALPEIRDVEAVARKALVEVREAVAGYRRRGLPEELDGARAALEAAGTHVTVRLAGTPLPEELDGLLGWAVREGVTNVIRHARASRCEIGVISGGDVTVLEIADDGCGAEPYEPGSGLRGLAERVEAAGGVVSAGPRKDGFVLRVTVPAAAGEARA